MYTHPWFRYFLVCEFNQPCVRGHPSPEPGSHSRSSQHSQSFGSLCLAQLSVDVLPGWTKHGVGKGLTLRNLLAPSLPILTDRRNSIGQFLPPSMRYTDHKLSCH